MGERKRSIGETGDSAARLDYRAADGLVSDDATIEMGGFPQRPFDLFPPYCCACLMETDRTWTSAQGMSVPMCGRCRRRWFWIRGSTIATAVLAALVLFVRWSFEPSRDRFGSMWWTQMIAAFVGAAVMWPLVLVQVVELFAPARCWSSRNGRKFFLRFRNRDYHRMARGWMAGGRTEAMAPQGFPIPPAHLKPEAQTRVR